MKKTIILFAILALFTVVLISCGKSNNNSYGGTDAATTPSATTQTSVIEEPSIDLSLYKVIRSDSAPLTVRRFATRTVEKVKEFTGAELQIGSDAEADNGAYEILVGETNRQASVDALAELNTKPNSNYLIKITDKKIVIIGKDTEGLVMGVKEFENRVLKKSEGNGIIPVTVGYTYTGFGEYDYLFENGVTLTLGKTNTIFGIGKDSSYYSYPTVIQLCHNGENNGVLLASCEGSSFEIRRSDDDGKTWTSVSKLGGVKTKSGLLPIWMPFLYELPADMGKYKEGTIILSCTTANSEYNTFTKSAISFYASDDLGKTWEPLNDAALGGGGPDCASSYRLGVWEPFLEYDNETGRLYCFYSDDSDPKHDQKLVCKWTEDLVNWSDIIDVVKFNDSYQRPGMPVLSKMSNGKYALFYERDHYSSESESACVCYMKIGSLDNWGDPNDSGIHVVTKDGKDCCASPSTAYTPLGGDCGILFAMGRWTSSDRKEQSELFISFDYGKTFTSIPNPIEFDPLRCGWSGSMFVSEDGKTLYYANNTRADNSTGNSGNTHLNLVKITIAE